MTVKAWYSIPTDKEEEFRDSFYDELKNYPSEKFKLEFIELCPSDKYSIIAIREKNIDDSRSNIYIPVKYDFITEYLLLNHQYLDEWTL
jgi:hypothetical protein